MDANILCTLLSQRIPPEQFQLWGLDIHWMSPDFDTPENRAIVEDVIANYATLEAEYLATQAKEKATAEIKANLIEIDLKSIRSIRERMAIQPDAPKFLVLHEAAAKAERAKLINP